MTEKKLWAILVVSAVVLMSCEFISSLPLSSNSDQQPIVARDEDNDNEAAGDTDNEPGEDAGNEEPGEEEGEESGEGDGGSLSGGGALLNDNDIYIVGYYDPDRDPFDDLDRAVRLAQKRNKRILLVLGGDWCYWCGVLEGVMHDSEEVVEALRQHWFVIKVNVSEENENEDFLDQYPEIPGYPHLFVLETDGEFLHAQSVTEFGGGDGYDPELILDFLLEWAP